MINYNCQNCGDKVTIIYSKEASGFPKNYKNIKEGKILICSRCLKEYEARKADLEKIINSSNKDKKIIVAGPGTGKTFTFLEYLRRFKKKDKVQITTFGKNLTNDLIKEVDDYYSKEKLKIDRKNIKINTFHSFCRKELAKHIGYNYFGDLTKLIVRDYCSENYSKNEKVLVESLQELKLDNNKFKFYFRMSKYYKAVGHDNVVPALFVALKKNLIKINDLDFSEMIVDEFQDFNYSEFKLIDSISNYKKILVAGDDDQVLYFFKNAHPRFIRELWKRDDYEKLHLNYCNRCTEAIVDSVNYFLKQLIDNNFLDSDRIEREYKCYYPDKYEDSKKYPYIYHYRINISASAVKALLKIINILIKNKETKENKLNFLIICPRLRSKNFIPLIKEKIKNNKDIDFNVVEKGREFDELAVKDGYELIKKDKKSNLGWRIVLHFDPIGNVKEIVEKGVKNNINLYDLLDKSYIKKHSDLMKNFVDDNVIEIKQSKGKINIMITNFLGSKGLTADHTMMFFINDRVIPEKNKIRIEEIYKFLVGLSRARKSLHIFSNHEKCFKSTFLNMLPQEKIKKIKWKELKDMDNFV